MGDALDWWRVEDIEENHRLRLRAEMRLPGLAWLELVVDTDDSEPIGRTLFRQRAAGGGCQVLDPVRRARSRSWAKAVPVASSSKTEQIHRPKRLPYSK